jgi:hypothetical protein
MKRFLATFAVLVFGALSSYGSQTRSNYQNQFHVPHTSKQVRTRAQALAKKDAIKPAVAKNHLPGPSKTQAHIAHVKAHNSSATTLGFISATQIPAGGDAEDPAYLGDFNGDGKKDLITLVENHVNGSYVESISVVLSNGNGTFKPAVLTTVNNDDPILVGDVNGDGKDDVIQAHPNTTPSTVDVWLSNGDGTFTEGHSYQVSPASLQGGILTDVDGDGKLDLLAIDSQTPGLVRTLLGNGDGTFQAATSITLPAQAPGNIVFADFNGDGKIDFAGLDNNEQVNIYVQAGGNFVLTGQPLTTPDSQYGICAMQAADLNGDGAAEVVTENCGEENDNTVTVYVNNGDGTFATGVYYADAASGGESPANLYPYAGIIADVNGDGKNDVVVTNYYGGGITILTGNGDGTVNVPDTGYGTGGDYTYRAALVADFNGDGKADIVQIDDAYSYAYLQGYGDGTFRAAVDYYGAINDGSWSEAVTVATGDFNGDGFPDFAVGNSDSESAGITIFLSRGDGSLQHGVNYGSGGNLLTVAVADFDGDGKLDVAAVNVNNQVVQIFNGVGDGTFTTGSSYSTGANEGSCSWGIVTGDFNHDQHTDLAVVNYDCDDEGNSVGVLLNDGTGAFLSAVTYSLSSTAYGIAAGDINGDGNTDLLVPLVSGNSVAVLLGNNNGTFQNEYDVALTNGNASYSNPQYITVGDFNGDGNLDFAVTIDNYSSGNQGVAVALGKGDGTFNTPSLYSTTNQDFASFEWPYPANVQAADINGDGIPDLVYSNSRFGTVGVLFGNGNGTFGTPNEYPAGNSIFGFALADVNGDGALDVVSANWAADSVTVQLNGNGSGSQSSFTVGATTTTATVAAGSPAAYSLALTGIHGYTGTVTFSCSGLPAHSNCSFSPSSIVASGVSQSTALTIHTTAASASLVQPALPNSKPGAPTFLASLSGIGLFGLVLAAGGGKHNRRQMAIVLGVLLLAMIFTLAGCSTGPSSPGGSAGTPAGTYTVVVTATGTGSNAPTHTMNLTLIVQ